MIEINLLPENLKSKAAKEGTGFPQTKYFLYLVLAFFGLLICAHLYLLALGIFKNYQSHALNAKWQKLKPQREAWENLKKEYAVLSGDVKIVEQLIKERIIWSERLNKLSLALPAQIWFNEITVTPKEFNLKGSVVSLQKEEMSLINKFMDTLKNDTGFFKDFQMIELSSLQRRVLGGYDIIDFIINGSLKPK